MTTGIALSGGGLKCIAHIGALKVLADIDVEIDAQGTGLLDVDDFEKCYKSGYDAVMRNNLLQNNL